MLKIPKLRELSFLVYGLGLSGRSVIKFFKKNKINNFKIWDDDQKKILKNYRPKNLIKTLNKVDYIVLSPGISLVKNKYLNISEKKLYTFGMSAQSKQFKVITKLQDKNMKGLAKFLYKVFNQIKIINTN